MQVKGCELLLNCTAEEWVRLQHFDDFSGSKKQKTRHAEFHISHVNITRIWTNEINKRLVK